MENNEALVHVPQQALVTAGGLGLEGISIKPSIMELVQRTSRAADVTPGQFRDTESNLHYPTLQIVPLHRQTKRVYFPPGGELGAEPLCRSTDGLRPSPFAQVPQSDNCGTCTKGDKMWATYKETHCKPECQLVYELLFVLRDTLLPYRMNFKGMAIKPLSSLMAQLYKGVLIARSKGENPNIFEYTMEMYPQFIQGGKGAYYVPGFRNLSRIKPEDRASFGPAYEQFVMRYEQAEQEAVQDQQIEEGMNGEVVPMGVIEA